MKNKVYNRPEIEIVRFETEDVLREGISLPDMDLLPTSRSKAYNMNDDSGDSIRL